MQRSFFDDEFSKDMEVKKLATYETFKLDEKKTESMADRLLYVLKDGEPHSTNELFMRVSHRFAVAVSELRNSGHEIIREQDGDTHWYQKVGFTERVKVTDEMKEAYYRTKWWRQVRLERLGHDFGKCVDCKTDENLVVHHWKYNLFGERICDLMTLCERCHERIHSNPAIKVAFPKSVTPEIASRLNEV